MHSVTNRNGRKEETRWLSIKHQNVFTIGLHKKKAIITIIKQAKLSPRWTKHHAMKLFTVSDGLAPRILTLRVYTWGEWAASRPGRFRPRKGTHSVPTEQ